MILEIKVIPNAKKNVIKKDGDRYKVYLTAPAVDGKANKKLVEFLSEHFGVRKSGVFIKMGVKSRYKVVVIRG
ncbi:MAG: DUF167 domain-containing protein [Elusimicrobia bacterium]|nr:DUF167 domain-containing protein [Elusimicrobiota bacterium]